MSMTIVMNNKDVFLCSSSLFLSGFSEHILGGPPGPQNPYEPVETHTKGYLSTFLSNTQFALMNVCYCVCVFVPVGERGVPMHVCTCVCLCVCV